MKNFFRSKSRQGGGQAIETGVSPDAPVPPIQPEPAIPETIPLEIQKRMLRNIRHSLHNSTTAHQND
jgi:hypothetical protein